MERKKILHMRNLKKTLNHGLKLEKIHRLIGFNQKELIRKN